jgi:ribonucleoside-diphosphate reductase alpha chain
MNEGVLSKISANAIKVLERRYLMKDEQGENIETVEELFWRVAKAVAAADRHFDAAADTDATAQRFFTMMTELEFLPNSPTLMNAGRELGQLAACFVLPVADSMEDIFEAIKNAALIHKSGGGTGFSFSRLRPSGSSVRTTGGVASGPISFMRVFNMATEAVKQGGTRRGANMGILRVDHPDILEFIACKANNQDITNFNISVGLTEAFMRAVEQGSGYDLIDPHSGRPLESLNAREVFDKIVHQAWQNGEPGIIFLDRLNRDNPVPGQGEIESTNPCGEQPLLPYESCNLGSINLLAALGEEDGAYAVDYDKLESLAEEAVHFLDNVIEINRYPLPQIEEVTKQTRKIGLGLMGFADMLLMMGIPYNAPEAAQVAGRVMERLREAARRASARLAKERGAFPLYAESVFADVLPQRNATVTTIAPTGTLSIIANVSSGIEPVFAFVFTRNIMDNTRLIEINPILKRVLTERGLYSEDMLSRIAEAGALQNMEEIPEDIRRVFVCARDISPVDHITMQAAFQKFTDNAVSKTVNFPAAATEDEVREVFLRACELGCKGVTIYRDGSRANQVLSAGPAANAADTAAADCIKPRPRPALVCGVTERMQTGCGNLYVTVNYDEHGICEVFTSTGKAGGCPSQSEALSRLVSIALRGGICNADLLSQLRGIRCPATMRSSARNCTSCPDAIGRVLDKVANMLAGRGEDNSLAVLPADVLPVSARLSHDSQFCPDCGSRLTHQGGCVSCLDCGYSKCN